MYQYHATLARVIDGDTFALDIDLGFHITVRETVRLFGIDCPEIRTEEGKRAKAFTEAWFAGCTAGVYIETVRRPAGEVMTLGRWLAKVYGRGREAPNDDLAGLLRAFGHVKG